MKKLLMLILLLSFCGCGSSLTLLAWKPTIVVVKDNTAGNPEGDKGSIIVVASPSQPFEMSGNTATGLPTN
uniref:Uncharacterized protein n=1 Tax=viral metagenome TaxID=1070528 RepID=A0A6M3JB31_9ZZZZ